MTELGIVAHPIRIAILVATGTGERSPKDIASEIDGVTLGTVAYHVRELAKAKLLRTTRTKQVRGAIAHYYRVTPAARPLLERYAELVAAAAREVPNA